MGHYSEFFIGANRVASFKYSVGSEWWKVLSLIFQKGDYCKGRIRFEGKLRRYEGYKTTVKEAKRRLDIFHMSVIEIDSSLSRLLSFNRKTIEAGILDDEALEELTQSLSETESSRLYDYQSKVQEKIEIINIGNYGDIRYIRKKLDEAKNNQLVILDMSDVFSYLSHAEIKAELSKFDSRLDPALELERKYLPMAKVFFTTHDFDLVYIYLIIALEQELHDYYKKRARQLKPKDYYNINLERLSEELHFMDKLRLINILKRKNTINPNLIEKIDKAYQKRTSIVHHKSTKFNRFKVIEAIDAVEEVIKILNN